MTGKIHLKNTHLNEFVSVTLIGTESLLATLFLAGRATGHLNIFRVLAKYSVHKIHDNLKQQEYFAVSKAEIICSLESDFKMQINEKEMSTV